MPMEDRLYLVLDRLIESLQPPAIKAIGEIPPKGMWSPNIVTSAIVPAVGGTITDYPTILLASTPSSPTGGSSQQHWGVEGFAVHKHGNKIIIGGGKVVWGGKERWVEGKEIDISEIPAGSFVVVNLQTGEIKVTYTPGAIEWVIYFSR